MPAASRHAKPKTPVIRFGAPVAAAATLAGVAAAFVFLQGGSAAAGPSRHPIAVTITGPSLTDDQITTAVRRDAAALETRMARRASKAARTRHLAALAAARDARQRAAGQPSQPPPPPPPPPSPSPSPTPTPAPSSAGGDAASSPLGI